MTKQVKNPLKKKYSRLKRKFLVYIIVTFIVVFSITLEMIIETNSPIIKKEIMKNIKANRNIEEISYEDISAPLRHYQKKALLIDIILLTLLTLVFYLMIVEVITPLHKIIEGAKKIAKGDLTVHLDVNTTDEIKEIGDTINELTTNFQEIIIQLQNWVGNVSKGLNSLEQLLKETCLSEEERKKILDVLKEGKESTEMLDHFLKLFKVYKIPKEIQDLIDKKRGENNES